MLKSLHNPQEIRSYLKKRPARHLYELGDLGPFFWPYTQWWGWQTQAEIQALLLLYASEHGPSLLAFSEDNTAQLHLIQAAHAFLPARFHLQTTSQAEQLKTLYTLKAAEPHFRLKLNQNDFKPLSGHFQTKVLTTSDLPQIKALYQEAYPINWFEKRMLDTEMYLGTFISGKLIAI